MSTAPQNSILFSKAENTLKDYDSTKPWEKDLSGKNREKLASTLTAYFKQSQSSYVVAVHGEWGTGKSCFLRSWADWLLTQACEEQTSEASLEQKTPTDATPVIGLPCFRFNAWEFDHSDDALLAFSSSIIKQIEEQQKDKSSGIAQVREFVTNGALTALKDAPAVIETLTKFGIKTAFKWMKIDSDELVAAFVEDATNLAAKKLQLAFEASQSARQQVKKSIGEFAKACRQKTGCPIIIMVDELDRCKPSFAVDLLENIKHLFSVPHVIFVLALEENQRANCISAVYGLDKVGAKRYLGRFIDMQVRLPEVDIAQYVQAYAAAFPFLDKTTPRYGANESIDTQIRHYLSAVFSQLKLSLRDIHQVLCRLAVIGAREQNNVLYVILCGKALARLQRKDNLENILELGDLPKDFAINTSTIYPRHAQAIEQIETAIRNNLICNEVEGKLEQALASVYNPQDRESWNKKDVNIRSACLIKDNYYISYTGANSDKMPSGIFNHYKKCIERDLSTVAGIDFSL